MCPAFCGIFLKRQINFIHKWVMNYIFVGKIEQYDFLIFADDFD